MRILKIFFLLMSSVFCTKVNVFLRFYRTCFKGSFIENHHYLEIVITTYIDANNMFIGGILVHCRVLTCTPMSIHGTNRWRNCMG